VQFEFSYNQFHKGKEQIFRVNVISTSPKSESIYSSIRVPYGPALTSEIPEIVEHVRIAHGGRESIKWEQKRVKVDNLLFTDDNFFQFFTFDLLIGHPSKVLQGNNIVITDDCANRLFGNQDPIGQQVLIQDIMYIVEGVAESPPNNSDIRFDAVVPIKARLNSPNIYIGWDGGASANTYVRLEQKAIPENVEAKFAPFLWDKVNKKNEGSQWFTKFYLEPLTKMHLFSDVDGASIKKSTIRSVLVLLFVSCIILIVAILNFIFISNGVLSFRGKEFHVKRFLGSGKLEIMKQVFVENLLLFSGAVLLSLFFIISFQDRISYLFGYSFDFITGKIWIDFLFLIPFVILISLFTSAGSSYRYLTENSVAPSNKLSHIAYRNKKLAFVSAIQFCLAIVLIISVIVTRKQLNYALNKDLGFMTENVIQISHPSIGQKRDVLINEIGKLPGVRNITASFGIPGLETTMNGYRPEGDEQSYMYNAMYVDENFLDTYKIKLLEGNNFPKGEPGKNKKYIINKTLAKELGWSDPVGRTISRGGKHEIIGVVEDFHVASMFEKIPPLIISREHQSNFYSLSIAVETGQLNQTLPGIEKSWEEIIPDAPFTYSFFDAMFGALYSKVKRTGTILSIFTCVAILISMLGLFGITLMLVNGKIKEIGIRKVNGAKVSEILEMLNRDFIKWVVIAFVIAVPVAYYLMSKWLESFAYKTELSWWVFALAGAMALGIAILTISWQSWKAATRNPVEALRYE
jgi:putative ABC transport system permease protein